MTTSPALPATGVRDSRRLTGPSLLLHRPGAVIDVTLDGLDPDKAATAWRHSITRLLHGLGWAGEELACRRFKGGLSLAFSAPPDSLYAATDINERAWAIALAELDGVPANLEAELSELRKSVEQERNPALLALYQAAHTRGLTFLSGEDQVSVGSGAGALTWPADALPTPDAVDWSRAHDVPIALITGSNGKTTVVRLLGAMAAAGGRIPGLTSTDGVTVGGNTIVEGDFSGPSGARMVLRNPEVETAILETARGGILRRGLSVDQADVAVVTNVAADHLGEFGVESLPDLAETKLVVAKALGPTGTLVLNADDDQLVDRSRRMSAAIVWFSLDSHSQQISRHVAAGGRAVFVDRDEIVVAGGRERETLTALADVPLTFGGSATHNVANALAAVAAASALGIGREGITGALRQFGRFAGDNPGRANLLELGGVQLLLDYAHNPHGMDALVKVAERLPARRRLVMLGQAGDRDDEAIRQLARAAWALRPDHVVVKEMDQYLRGRAPGEVPGILADEFSRLGVPDKDISRAALEVDGARIALAWARPGDLLVLAVHQDRRAVLGLLSRLAGAAWKAGEPLPGDVHAT